jgi:hypothetical protein
MGDADGAAMSADKLAEVEKPLGNDIRCLTLWAGAMPTSPAVYRPALWEYPAALVVGGAAFSNAVLKHSERRGEQNWQFCAAPRGQLANRRRRRVGRFPTRNNGKVAR